MNYSPVKISLVRFIIVYPVAGPMLELLLLVPESCGSKSEDIQVDCTTTDLTLSIVESLKSDCGKPGSVTVLAVGGEEPYSYSIDEVDFQNSPKFDNLFAGEFIITVMDNLGCLASISFVLESEPNGIILDLNSSNTDCGLESGSVEAFASGGRGTLLYALNGGQFSQTNIFTDLMQGEYEITVKDQENCEVSKSVRVNSNVSLTTNIMPIIQKDCAISGCHNGSQSPRLTTKQGVIQNASRIRSETQARTMPRNGSLTDNEIDLIACWVDDGAKDN